jgi:DNA-binding NarL/FixJ family response regulator
MAVRVVIFDDHEDGRTALAHRLERAPDIDVIGAAADLDAAAALIANADVDLTLLALHQQDGEWAETCRRLATLSDAPLVVLASFMTPELWKTARRAGAADYLLRHIDSARLRREITRVASRHRAGKDGAG